MKRLIAATSLILAGTAFAAKTNKTTATMTPSAWDTFKEKTSISYFGEFNDQSIDPDEDLEAVNQNFYYNLISFRYKLTDTWTARADLRFETDEGVADPYTELDTRLGIQGVFYSSGNFSLFNLTRLEIATTDSSHDKQRMFKPRVYTAANYGFGAQSISLGFEFAKWLYEHGDEQLEKDGGLSKLDTFMDITYRYRFQDWVSFQLYYELGGKTRPTKPTGDLIENGERILIGADFTLVKNFMDIMKNLTFYPHIDYQPDNDREIGDLGVGAWISAGFFQ